MARTYDGEFLDFAESQGSLLRRTAFLMCGDWERARDLTQEALVRLYVAWPRLEHGPELTAYARRTVTSIAIDWGRRRSSTEVRQADPAERERTVDPTDDVAERMAVTEALGALPPRQRACVVLRFYEDLPVAEVAELLGCREGTVKSQTARGLETLRAVLADLGASEGASS